MQHMVLSLSTRVRVGLSVQSLSELYTDRPTRTLVESDSTYAACIQCILLEMGI